MDISLAIGADGLPIIAYSNNYDGLLSAHCTDEICSDADLAVIDSTGGGYLSITVGHDELPIISYQGGQIDDGKLKVAHCNDHACTSTTKSLIEIGSDPSMAIGADGLPIISFNGYVEGNMPALKVAHCNNLTCGP